jgi:hypothetical protein
MFLAKPAWLKSLTAEPRGYKQVARKRYNDYIIL